MIYSDDPVRDYERYYEEQERKIELYPVCDRCGRHIIAQYKYPIDGHEFCEECAHDYIESIKEEIIL